MSQRLVLIPEDMLKSMIKEVVLEALSEKVPYCSPTDNIKKLLTRQQAADYLGVIPNTVTKYVREGKITAAIINGKYRFFESNLLKYLNKSGI